MSHQSSFNFGYISFLLVWYTVPIIQQERTKQIIWKLGKFIWENNVSKTVKIWGESPYMRICKLWLIKQLLFFNEKKRQEYLNQH